MATTTNGIYYPNDYETVADIPADMKKLAESVDTKIAENETEIENIKEEQKTQNTNISNLQADNETNKQDITEIKAKDTDQDKYIAELEAENTRLREDLNGLPTRPASGESIDLSDSAEMRCDLKISGNSKQETREGYNLLKTNLPKDVKTYTVAGVTFTLNNNGIITAKGISTGAFIFSISNLNPPELKSGKTYTLYCKLNGTKTGNNVFVISGRDSNNNLIYGDSSLNSNGKLNKSKSVTEDHNLSLIQFYCNGSDVQLDCNLEVMVYEGTEEKEYEPYGASPSPDYPSEVECCGDNGSINEVICNKNLFNYKTIKMNSAIQDNGNLDYSNYNFTSDYIYIFPNKTYVVNDAVSCVFEFDKNKKIIKALRNTDKGGTFTTSVNARYVRIRNYYSTSDLTELAKQGMLIEGSILPSSYVEHKSQTYTIPVQQPIRSVGDIRDTFIKKDGKRYEHHPIFRKIFDGTENWVISGNYKDYYELNDNNLIKHKANTDSICNNYKMVPIGFSTENNDIGFTTQLGNTGQIRIRPKDELLNNLEAFKGYLQAQYEAGTPVYVDYILETPLDIECTEEQNKILDQIEKEAKTYKGTTHIYSTDNISPVIDVTYKIDLETLIAGSGVQ